MMPKIVGWNDVNGRPGCIPRLRCQHCGREWWETEQPCYCEEEEEDVCYYDDEDLGVQNEDID